MMASRTRETNETCIEVFLKTDGAGIIKVDTGIPLLDEILRSMAQAGGFDLTVTARGDLQTGDHHTAEDTAITLGSTLGEAVKSGIGSSIVPSGQALAMAAVRFGEPGYQGDFELQSAAYGRHEPGESASLSARPGLQRPVQPGHLRQRGR